MQMELSLNASGLRAMFVYSNKKLLTNRRWLIVAVVAALIGVVMGYSATLTKDALMGGSDMLNLLVLSFLLPILSMIFGASIIRNDIDDRSITQVLTSPVDRRVSYLGYYLSLLTVLIAALLLILLVGWTGFYLVAGSGGSAIGMLAAYAGVLVLGAIVYSSLFLVMGVVLKQPIYLGLFYVFIWEGFVGSLPGAIGEFTIMHQLKVIAAGQIPYGSIADTQGDALASLVALAVASIVLLVLGAFALREKQVP
jgi:ABC-type transport system involved in multi-copper enzyme maturation permease subunit